MVIKANPLVITAFDKKDEKQIYLNIDRKCAKIGKIFNSSFPMFYTGRRQWWENH